MVDTARLRARSGLEVVREASSRSERTVAEGTGYARASMNPGIEMLRISSIGTSMLSPEKHAHLSQIVLILEAFFTAIAPVDPPVIIRIHVLSCRVEGVKIF
jgi:hypothetical protein